MTLEEWKLLGRPDSRWRARSRAVMQIAVSEHEANCKGDPVALIRMVDAAYPFSERAMHPYKCWLQERRIFINALTALPAPTRDEIEVCEVARDMVEWGRADEARKLVEERAPNRLARKCPACGAKISKACVDYEAATDADHAAWEEMRAGRCASLVTDPPSDREIELIVPHQARLVGHLGAGPLFGEASP